MRAPLALLQGLVALTLIAAGPAFAQVTPGGTPPGTVGRPAPVESAPLPPPGTPTEQAVPPAAPTPPAAQAAPPTRVTTAGRATLIPEPGDPADVDQVTMPAKPAAVLSGTSTWDEGFTNLQNAFRKIEEELTRAAIAPVGKPLTVFLETDDMGFRYEAMVPIAEAPAGRATLTPEVRFGSTPEGAAMRFVHKGAYEEIDETYETITAYLDAKGVAVKDIFVEEYATDLIGRDDPNLEVNIFVQPK
jgi:effector-binding domain-containing protein